MFSFFGNKEKRVEPIHELAQTEKPDFHAQEQASLETLAGENDHRRTAVELMSKSTDFIEKNL